MKAPKARASGSRRSLRGVLLYYVVLGAVMGWLAWKVPLIQEVMTLSPGAGGLTDEITRTFGGQSTIGQVGITGWQGVIVATLSMIGALIIMVPVAWTYIVVKRHSSYTQSMVHTLLILPVAVTGTVVIVQTSIALAFSLAGIVAAVRFRTTLDDTKDAVYVFLAIGVGLASGVQALGVAAALSLVFNVVNLVLWRINFGNIYADQGGRNLALNLGDVLAGPESGESAVSFGNEQLLNAMSVDELRDVADRVSRMERHLEAEADTHKERKLYTVLMVHAKSVGPVQALVDPLLEQLAVRWRLAEILPGTGGVSVLEYLVRLRDGVSAGALLDQIQTLGGDKVQAAELRSLKGLRKRS